MKIKLYDFLKYVITFVMWASFWTFAIILIPLFIFISLFVRTEKIKNFMVFCICRVLHLSVLLFPRIKNTGKNTIDFPVIYVANHVSFFDLFIFGSVLPGNPRGFENVKHFKYPVYGWFISHFGQIPIDTTSRKSILHSIRYASEKINNKERSILLMPEGTRTRNGLIGQFHSGAFLLSIETGVPIVPVVFKNLYEHTNAADYFIKPGIIDVVIGAPILPQDFPNKEEMQSYTHNYMSQLLEE